MNHLENKYQKDKLTPEEFLKLRTHIRSMPDEEIEQQLRASWFQEDIDTSFVDDERMHRIKSNIDAHIHKKNSNALSLLIRWSQYAAVILLPLFIILTIYFYRESTALSSEEMIVSTNKAERANVTLPDGTLIALNMESRLAYLPKDYNKKERKISFSGEGYFQIHSNAEVPFLIDAKGMQVKVLGTVFNLAVREEKNTAELALEEGSVLLLSTSSNENVILQKNQKAILDHSTGSITVVSDKNLRDTSAWQRGDMSFHNTELWAVIRSIEENYNVTIKVECSACMTDPFTGTLPINNLNEVLEVIERSFHLKAVIAGKEILMKSI